MPGVQSVERAFAVLRATAAGPSGISDIARRLHLPTSTVARMLATLEELGAVERVGEGFDYAVGPTILELANGSRGTSLTGVARVFLQELVERVGETAGVSVLESGLVHYLDHVASDNSIQIRDWTGTRLAPHVTSSGLVMLSHLPTAELEILLKQPLDRLTERTITRPAELRARLDEVRHAGVSWTVEELEPGISSVAAPVFNATGECIAAIHVHGPSYRFPAGKRDLAESAVTDIADRLSARLSADAG